MTGRDDTQDPPAATPPAGATPSATGDSPPGSQPPSPPETGEAGVPGEPPRTARATTGSRPLESFVQELDGDDESEAPPEKPPRFTDSYGLVLLMLIASYFTMAITGNDNYGRAASLVVLAATTWLALRASNIGRRLLRAAVALIPVVTLVAVIAVILGSDETGRAVSAALTVLLVVVAPVAIVRRLASHLVVNLNTFFGAVCVYLLLAMFFASSFGLSAAFSGHEFFAQIDPPAKPTSVDYLYFSFITITTVGYGDLTAKYSVGRMLAVMEAIFGQLYLITVVALVVQNLGRERRFKGRGRRPPPRG